MQRPTILYRRIFGPASRPLRDDVQRAGSQCQSSVKGDMIACASQCPRQPSAPSSAAAPPPDCQNAGEGESTRVARDGLRRCCRFPLPPPRPSPAARAESQRTTSKAAMASAFVPLHGVRLCQAIRSALARRFQGRSPQAIFVGGVRQSPGRSTLNSMVRQSCELLGIILPP
jgi:hypothetical protein